MHDSTRILLEYNAGRDPERLTRKLDAIAADPFSFFRGTNNLYAASLADAALLHDAPRTLVCGDLHLENFGSFKGDNGLVYFDMNDFDEALAAPFTVDLVRVLSSLQVASFSWKLADEDAYNLCRRFLDTYAATLVDGKPRWVERATATGIVRNLLRGLRKRNRAAYLADRTERNGNQVTLRIDGRRTLRASKEEARRARRILEAYGQQGSGQRFIAIDVARRIAGTGSLGLERYSVLARPENDPTTLRLIDIKLSIPSVWDDVLGDACSVAPWRSEAGRVVDIQRLSQAISPALLRGVVYSAKGEKPKSYVVKSLQPTADRVALGSGKNVVANLDDALQTMARVAAWCHLRGCGRHGTDLVEKVQDYAAGTAWRKSALKLAAHGKGVSLKQWAEFAEDYRQARSGKAA
ncbi:succinate-semialdehyde dehydrogenase [Burkholderiaceae bacterium 26]|nr:succinate-semialdehyde dehydrogenase [Burkholderiaceae bacterium 26]